MQRKKQKEHIPDKPLMVSETEDGAVTLLVDHRVVPQWRPPRNPKTATLEEIALEVDDYPLYAFDKPNGIRVFLINDKIYDEAGYLLPRDVIGLFAPLVEIVNNSNVAMEGYMCVNPHREQTELILCDCFFGQD